MHTLLAILETETQRVERVTTVVVVDDDPDYLWLVRFILESGPDKTVIVGETASGEEALALVLQKRPDVVIADLMMPRLNGLELTRRIKQERPQTKILLMSAYTEDTYRRIASVRLGRDNRELHVLHETVIRRQADEPLAEVAPELSHPSPELGAKLRGAGVEQPDQRVRCPRVPLT